MTKILECSSKGDKRFSALFAKVEVFGKFDSIEAHYQGCKEFLDESGNIVRASDWKEAKAWQKAGNKPVRINVNGLTLPMDYLTSFYKLLWVKYLDANQSLVEYAKGFDQFNDIFRGKNTMNCQADVVKQYVKEGRASIMAECLSFNRLLSKKTFVIEGTGDLLSCRENIIGHQVNCQGYMGAGLAVNIRSQYPRAFEEYELFCKIYKNERTLMGKCQVVSVIPEEKWVANLFGQFNVGRGKKQTEDDYLRMALGSLKDFAIKHQLSVALPFELGSRLAGGNWIEIRKIIEEVFHDYYVTIYRLPME